MKTSVSIQVKAAFLLAIIALNSGAGFVCAADLPGCIHDNDKKAIFAPAINNRDDKENLREEKKVTRYQYKSGHQNPVYNEKKSSKTDKGNCCKDKLRQFGQVDK